MYIKVLFTACLRLFYFFVIISNRYGGGEITTLPDIDTNTNPKPRNLLFFVICVLLLVLFISVLSFVYSSQIEVFWQTTNEMIVLNTKEYERTLSLWFAPKITLVDTIYEDLLHFNLNERNELDSFFTSVTDANQLVMATYIATEDKRVVFDRGQEAPEGFDPTIRSWYIHAMENFGRTVVSEPYIDILTGKLVVTATRAIQLRGGLNGAIGVDFDLSELADFINDIHSYKNGSAFLLSSTGKIITHENDMFLPVIIDEAAVFINYSDIPVSDVAKVEVSSSEVFLERLVRDGIQEYVSTINVKEVDWIFGIKIPISDFDESLWQIATPLLITLILGLFVFAGSIVLYMLHMMQLIKANDLIKQQKLELAEQMQTIEKLGLIDALTNIPNRRHFDSRSDEEWKRCIREKKVCSLCMVDIDHFKRFNDKFGHQYGDEALKLVADLIKTVVRRPGDMAARWGGEEFVILLPNTDIDFAQIIAEDVRHNAENIVMPETASGKKAKLTVSVGVASILPDIDNSFSELVSNADKALYNAKQTGRNKVCVYR